WTLVDANTLFYEATIDDPAVFTQPWRFAMTFDRSKDQELWEDSCYEGERSVDKMVIVGRRMKAAGEPTMHEHLPAERDRWIKEAQKIGAPQGRQAIEATAGAHGK